MKTFETKIFSVLRILLHFSLTVCAGLIDLNHLI